MTFWSSRKYATNGSREYKTLLCLVYFEHTILIFFLNPSPKAVSFKKKYNKIINKRECTNKKVKSIKINS